MLSWTDHERLASLDRVPLPPPLQDTVDLSRFERLSNLCVVPGLIRLHMERRRSERLPPVPLADGADPSTRRDAKRR